MRSFRSMFFFAIIWAHFKRTEFFGSLWILDFGIYLFVPAWIIQCVQHFFQCVCVCAREFFSHLSFAYRVSNGNSVKRKLLVCVKICKFTFAAFHSVSVYFFSFSLSKKSQTSKERYKNGTEWNGKVK